MRRYLINIFSKTPHHTASVTWLTEIPLKIKFVSGIRGAGVINLLERGQGIRACVVRSSFYIRRKANYLFFSR